MRTALVAERRLELARALAFYPSGDAVPFTTLLPPYRQLPPWLIAGASVAVHADMRLTMILRLLYFKVHCKIHCEVEREMECKIVVRSRNVKL